MINIILVLKLILLLPAHHIYYGAFTFYESDIEALPTK